MVFPPLKVWHLLLIDENYPVTMGKLEYVSAKTARFSYPGYDNHVEPNFYEATWGLARIDIDGLSGFLKDGQ